MSPPPMNRELRMLSPAQRPTRITPLFQDRKSKRLTISIPESVAWLETPSWCQVEQHLLSPDLNAEFETFYIELPQATTCESLNSFCPRGENLESPAGTPRSKDPPGEWSDSTGSLRVFGSEVVESSSFLGGDAMEEDDQEGGPPTK